MTSTSAYAFSVWRGIIGMPIAGVDVDRAFEALWRPLSALSFVLLLEPSTVSALWYVAARNV